MELKTKFYYNKQTLFYICLLFLFALASILLLLRHEPWRDEAKLWQFSREYGFSFLLTREIRGETFPIEIVHIIGPILYKLGLPYLSYPIMNFLIMFIAIILFLFNAPFSRLQKVLCIFSYYMFYEYNIIARSWAYSVLFLFCLAVFYKERFKRPILYNIFLLFLAFTQVYASIIAMILAITYYFELFWHIKSKDTNIPVFNRKHFFSIILLCLGFVYIFYPILHSQNVPEEFTKWNTTLSIYHLGTIPTAVVDAFLPVPKLQINFWQSRGISRALYGPPLFLLTLLFFIRKPLPLFMYISFCFSLFAIYFFRFIPAFRHAGLLFIIFIFCLWIAENYPENEKIRFRVSKRTCNILLIIILSIQVIAAGIAFYYDWRYEFSSGKSAAAFLKESGFLSNKTFIASYPSVEMAPILIFTPEYPKFYFIEYQDFHSFIDKNVYSFYFRSHPLVELTEFIENATKDKKYPTILLILDRKIMPYEEDAEHYRLIASFEENIINTPIVIYEKVSSA